MSPAGFGMTSPGFDRGGPTLAETGETEVLSRLRALSGAHGRLEVGPGDDAAVWRPPPGRDVVTSQDATVEGVDFVRRWSSPRQVGRRALATALSDLAGMGAVAAWCQVTLCAPADTRLDDVLELQLGLLDVAAETGCTLAGGDLSAIDGPLVVDVSVGGTVAPGALLRRDRGRPGDLLLVTGTAGRAAAGLRLLQEADGTPTAGAVVSRWIAAQREPAARLAEGQALVAAGIRCGGDTSDGLVMDATRTAAASGCGAELWLGSVPMDPELRDAFAGDWVSLALTGGEDFELLAAAPPAVAERLLASWPAALAPLRVVGRLVPGDGITLLTGRDGTALPVPPQRSRHFA